MSDDGWRKVEKNERKKITRMVMYKIDGDKKIEKECKIEELKR